MGVDNFSRLKGRGLAHKLNQYIVSGLFLMGMSVAGVLFSIAALFVSLYFILTIVLFCVLTWIIGGYLKKVSAARASLGSAMYPSDDKSYVWHVESVRDKLMARMIQEGICPWNEGLCNSKNTCFCLSQKILLNELDIDTDKKQKIVLDAKDANT